jgi:hypothetical protein
MANSEHGPVEARHHLEGGLAADPVVHHGDGEGREQFLELDGEPAGIGRRRRAGAGSGGRRRADGDDPQRLAGGDAAGGARQRIVQPGEILVDGTGPADAFAGRNRGRPGREQGRRRERTRGRIPEMSVLQASPRPKNRFLPVASPTRP